ncbi:MAG TPA: protease modulator HflC [Alphaproteobacteria bacterium]|jgi:membrane protease subunit HflC|nr:protease modulator HflC [Alphaproteobacteria bacterium]
MQYGRNLIGVGVLAIIALLVLTGSFFTVSETEQAIVLQFGAVKRIEQNAGLKFKVPLVQDVVFYDKRLLDIESPPQEVILSDQRRLVVDAYAVYQIVDPLKFYQAVRTDDGARLRLNSSINATLRDVLGGTTVASVLSKDREGVMQAIRAKVNAAAAPLGIAVADVRISRANFPDSISQSIYGQMKAERKREAAQFRAEGYEQAQQIQATADRERTVILADAKRQSDILHGEGDAQATQIFAESFGRDPDFYAFYRSLEAYKKAMGGDDTQFVLSPNSDFLRYFNRPDAGKTIAPK